MLEKTKMVLKLSSATLGDAEFRYDDPEWFRMTQVLLDGDVWNDMSRPEIITVTVEPGDQLNVDSLGS